MTEKIFNPFKCCTFLHLRCISKAFHVIELIMDTEGTLTYRGRSSFVSPLVCICPDSDFEHLAACTIFLDVGIGSACLGMTFL